MRTWGDRLALLGAIVATLLTVGALVGAVLLRTSQHCTECAAPVPIPVCAAKACGWEWACCDFIDPDLGMPRMDCDYERVCHCTAYRARMCRPCAQ
jgi:hypothetical protein